MASRLKLIVAYDGTDFAGWQSQSHGNTIQDHLERAFQCIGGEPVRVHGAGRTDAGVHALAQCAHVDLAQKKLSPADWSRALNALLPPTVRALRCSFVSQQFHARLCAKGKIYRYHLWSAPVLPPFEYGRAWHLPVAPKLADLQKAARPFVGTHDFAAFAANRGKPESNTTRTIHSVRIRQHGSRITIEFDGNGFLYKMVRLMVGALVQCSLGKQSAPDIAVELASGQGHGRRFVAPAAGLFLVRVRY